MATTVKEDIRVGTEEVQFDTHGMTDECPRFGGRCFEECCACPYYRGYEGFVVYCNYLRLMVEPFAETEP